jgi:hypothetical protein
MSGHDRTINQKLGAGFISFSPPPLPWMGMGGDGCSRSRVRVLSVDGVLRVVCAFKRVFGKLSDRAISVCIFVVNTSSIIQNAESTTGSLTP